MAKKDRPTPPDADTVWATEIEETPVAPPRPQARYVYDACCERCGHKHGEVHFDRPQPGWDPRQAGIACASCLREEG